MSKLTKDRFPTLTSVYLVPTLLEVGVKPESFSGALNIRDPDEIKRLKSGKGPKLAKRWAPIILFQALSQEIDDQSELSVTLKKVDDILQGSASNSWFSTFMEAGKKGVPPSQWIRSLPTGKKKILQSADKEWKRTASKIEAILTDWILLNPRTARELILSDPGGQSISLKKLSRFKPTA